MRRDSECLFTVRRVIGDGVAFGHLTPTDFNKNTKPANAEVKLSLAG
jgi:hypothetical protein